MSRMGCQQEARGARGEMRCSAELAGGAGAAKGRHPANNYFAAAGAEGERRA
jgi:hypothetical protein